MQLIHGRLRRTAELRDLALIAALAMSAVATAGSLDVFPIFPALGIMLLGRRS
jgi:hypothetical protein